MFKPVHHHLIATAVLAADFLMTEMLVRNWLIELVGIAGMSILNGPLTESCDEPGNEGITGIILLSTSHASLHHWFRGGPGDSSYLQFDLYSCREFNRYMILDFLSDTFRPVDLSFRLIDRTPRLRHS